MPTQTFLWWVLESHSFLTGSAVSIEVVGAVNPNTFVTLPLLQSDFDFQLSLSLSHRI